MVTSIQLEKPIGQIIRVGVDIAKSFFHMHSEDRFGERQCGGKYFRKKQLGAIEDKAPKETEIAMEACGSSHYWGRELQKTSFKVKIIRAQFVEPYVKSDKNDAVHAESICEAITRPNLRLVSVK